jgi:hypothetical protein
VTVVPLPDWVRKTPRIFYAVGVADFCKNMLPLYVYFTSGRFSSMDYSIDMRPQLAGIVLSAFIYAMNWVAYGVVATILLSIHDRLDPRDPVAEQGETDA